MTLIPTVFDVRLSMALYTSPYDLQQHVGGEGAGTLRNALATPTCLDTHPSPRRSTSSKSSAGSSLLTKDAAMLVILLQQGLRRPRRTVVAGCRLPDTLLAAARSRRVTTHRGRQGFQCMACVDAGECVASDFGRGCSLQWSSFEAETAAASSPSRI